MFKSIEHHTIETNGVHLHAVAAGPVDGPLVLMLHGFPEFWYGWRQQIPALAAAGYRVVTLDQRGYNVSDKPTGLDSYLADEMTGDAVDVLHALGRKSAYLVGHDWGAAITWHVALRHPEVVSRLAILNVPHPRVMMSFLKGSLKQMLKSWYMFFFQLPWLPEWVLRMNNWQTAVGMLRGSKSTSFTTEDYELYRQAWSQPGAMTAMLNWYRAMLQRRSTDLPDPRVHPPTLVIWGKQDVALGFEMAQPSVDLCDDGRLVMLEEASHFVQHDEAERVNQLLLEFFSTSP